LQISASIGCFFLDTIVVLSEILNEDATRIDKFKKDVDFHRIPCYICSSVERECKEKIESTLDFLGNVVRESVKFVLEESMRHRHVPTTSPIASEDIIALEELFSTLHGAARAIRPVPLVNPIRIVEEWVTIFLGEKLEQGATIDISQFQRELVAKLLLLTSSIEDPYDELVTFERSFAKKISISTEATIVDSLHGIGIHDPDAIHIASAVAHQTNNHEKAVFVTLDYGSIIAKQDEIKRVVNIICCDPLYAIYHLTQ